MGGAESGRGLVLPIAVTLVGLAAIGVAEDIPVRHSVEHNLTDSSSSALRRAGVPFSKVRFVGRDGTITVPSSDAGARAVAVVKHVNGVRVVDVVVVGSPTGGTPVIASPTPVVSLTAVPSAGAAPSASASPSSGTAPSASASPSSGTAPSASAAASPGGVPSSGATPPASAAPSPSPTQTAASVQKQLNALGEITFGSGSATLSARDRSIVKKAAAILKAHPSVDLKLTGDTDSLGPAAFNLTMSRRRAHAVADALHADGIATNRMTVIGYGETKPKVPNDSAKHRAINRRVDLTTRP